MASHVSVRHDRGNLRLDLAYVEIVTLANESPRGLRQGLQGLLLLILLHHGLSHGQLGELARRLGEIRLGERVVVVGVSVAIRGCFHRLARVASCVVTLLLRHLAWDRLRIKVVDICGDWFTHL